LALRSGFAYEPANVELPPTTRPAYARPPPTLPTLAPRPLSLLAHALSVPTAAHFRPPALLHLLLLSPSLSRAPLIVHAVA
ncbi:hypothetical protein FRC10_002059, partial [Ceratobasidium sp. 414]